ncbi:MAG: protein-disulfide reductase DsbD, partial [Gammaproteobacteria bacterium]|nr:protein-disulfide reductase DsbD [Gammaproteobacteria bacterium]
MHKRLLTALAGLWLLLVAGTVAATDFLAPEQAFRASAKATADKLQVTWKIADGYYLYRNKFRFQSETPGVELGAPLLPPSLTKDDEFFGRVDIYRNEVTVDVPVKAGAPVPDVVTVRTLSQGCADAGLCYPPQQQILLVALAPGADQPPQAGAGASSKEPSATAAAPPAAPAAAKTDGGKTLGALEKAFRALSSSDDVLPVEEAFRFGATVIDGQRLRLSWQIAPETYLYQDKVRARIEGDAATLLPLALPPPKIKKDTIRPDGEIGDVAVYADSFEIEAALTRSVTEATEVTLVAEFQGCADRGICYPPVKQRVTLQLPAVAAGAAAAPAVPASPMPVAATASVAEEPVAEQDRIAAMLQKGNVGLVVASFFGIGLLLAFTPCVFPMIPILSGIIAGQGRHITTRRAFVLSLVYVLAMALTYTVAGVLAGLFGQNLQAVFQDPWVIGVFAAVFVALALSMFGFYELQLPSSWQSRLAELSNRQQGGTLAGVAVMGLLSALIVGPCVAPPLAGALIYIGQTGDAVLGGLALFALSLGMGAPLIAIGTSAGQLLPRAGMWMDAIKAVFGVLMLAVAIYLLERVIPEVVAMLLWGGLLIVSGVYLGAFQHLPVEASGWRKLWKGLGLILAVYGALMLVGAAAGGKDTLQPLRGLTLGGSAGAATAQQKASFKRIKTTDDLDRELAAARSAGSPVMLDFYADWCVYCKQLEKYTFPDPAVQAAL